MTQKSSRPAGGASAPIGDRRKLELPARDAVKPDTPLRLAVAAALAYPDGSMTANGLRNEARRGLDVIQSGEALAGARRFVEGRGRHGNTSDI